MCVLLSITIYSKKIKIRVTQSKKESIEIENQTFQYHMPQQHR